MPPRLEKVIINGSSRHRLYKGFLLLDSNGCLVDAAVGERIVEDAHKKLQERFALTGFTLERLSDHPAVIHVMTPFLPLYTVKQRTLFILRLVAATSCLLEAAEKAHCQLAAAGVNPYHRENEEDPRALCADIHQVEVYDEGEVERIYNLYRQFLPELLAISTHSAVYGAAVQKDFSLRMRVNLASYLPRYISQFSEQHIEQLERFIRKKHKLSNLSQMDINPLGGDASALRKVHRPLLDKSVAAIELHFIDAQCSFPFIRAQVILLQAIAMHGRALAREGRRLFPVSDESLDENKALALHSGGGAVLRPDRHRKSDEGRKSSSSHERKEPEVATTALLALIEDLLMPPLRDLECEPWELYPITLGAELRRRERRCFVNYAEYQQYLCNAYPGERFIAILQEQTRQLLSSSTFDIICDYNRQLYQKLAQEIESVWSDKLAPRQRSAESGTSSIGRAVSKGEVPC
jgi:hypothetical protein